MPQLHSARFIWLAHSTSSCFFFFFQAEDGIRDLTVTGVQTCALPISDARRRSPTRPPAACRCRLPRRRQAGLSPAVAPRASIPQRRLLHATVRYQPGHLARRRDGEGGIERGNRRPRRAPPPARLFLRPAALLRPHSR